MSQTLTYDFTDASGNPVDLTVTASATASSFLGANAYAVTAITGDVNGVAITGIAGASEAVQTSADGASIYDNALFPVAGTGGVYSGFSGNTDGLDVYGLEFTAGGTEYNLYEQSGTFEFFATNNPNGEQVLTPVVIEPPAPCFCAGTLIRTPTGETAVETLAIGDLVLTVTGDAVPVRWVGTRVVATRFADKLRSSPIRIKAGALGNGLPLRDLLVSPDHAMFLDGVLVQAGALVNGVSIVRETTLPATFMYYHVETPGHALILAEGAATETFIDNVDRMAFDNWAEHEALYGDDTPLAELPYVRAKSARQVPLALRARLIAALQRAA